MFLPLPHSSTNPTFASLGCKILAEKNPSCMTKLLSMTIINLVLQTKVAKVPSITLLSLCPHLGQSDQHLPLHWAHACLLLLIIHTRPQVQALSSQTLQPHPPHPSTLLSHSTPSSPLRQHDPIHQPNPDPPPKPSPWVLCYPRPMERP